MELNVSYYLVLWIYFGVSLFDCDNVSSLSEIVVCNLTRFMKIINDFNWRGVDDVLINSHTLICIVLFNYTHTK